MPFDFMFNIMPFFFFIVFGLVITVFIVIGIRALSEWTRNNSQPVTAGHAMAVDKRIRRWGGALNSRAQTSYHITFQFEDGFRQEFRITGRVYGQITRGDSGTLIYQGTRYHNFQRVQL